MASPAPAETFQCPSCGFTIFNRRYPKCERCGSPIPDVFKYTAEQAREMNEHSLVTDFARFSEQIQALETAVGQLYLRVSISPSLRQLAAESALALSMLEQLCLAQENEILRSFSPGPSGNAVCAAAHRQPPSGTLRNVRTIPTTERASHPGATHDAGRSRSEETGHPCLSAPTRCGDRQHPPARTLRPRTPSLMECVNPSLSRP